jgi:hypothetical protein
MAGECGPESCARLRYPGAWLSENAGVVRHVTRRVARHCGLPPEAAAALESGVLTKLAENDYQMLRRYGGGADIETYLAVVVTRLLLDQRAASTGA